MIQRSCNSVTPYPVRFGKVVFARKGTPSEVMEPIKIQTPAELLQAFRLGAKVEIKGKVGIIEAIERKDGSGLSFNIRLSGSTDWFYVRLGKKS